jgi:6-phosphofructokinase 2
MPGPEYTEQEWRRCIEAFESAREFPHYVIASGSLPPGVPNDFYARLAHVVRTRGSKIIVDTSGEALRHAAETGVFLLKPNMRELAAIAGRDIEDEVDQEQVAKKLIAEGRSQVVVVSLGAAGALIVTRESSKRLRSPSVPIRSKVGAGDSMVAGIVLSLARGKELHDAVAYGMAAGAAAVMTPGSELCRRDDTERLYDRLIQDV